MYVEGTYFGQFSISSKKLGSHSTSTPALSKAMNSTSIIDLAIHACLENFYDTASLPRVKIYPIMDFESLQSDVQFTT